MATKRININVLDQDSIDNAIKELQKLADIENKIMDVMKKVAEYGLQQAEGYVVDAEVMATMLRSVVVGDTEVELLEIDKGYCIRLSGTQLYFLEYGAGVYYGGNYPGERPADLKAIGTFGKGYGSRSLWAYTSEYGNNTYKHLTRGNPPYAMAYKTTQDIKAKLIELFDKEFGK